MSKLNQTAQCELINQSNSGNELINGKVMVIRSAGRDLGSSPTQVIEFEGVTSEKKKKT